jgi:hypothetical protein
MQEWCTFSKQPIKVHITDTFRHKTFFELFLFIAAKWNATMYLFFFWNLGEISNGMFHTMRQMNYLNFYSCKLCSVSDSAK